MALGFFKIQYTSTVVQYHDEQTPIKLIGKKMLPIMVTNGKAMAESLDIIKSLPGSDSLGINSINSSQLSNFETYLNKLGGPIHNLCMPYWVWTPEFTIEARQYFEAKKSAKRGPFNLLAKKRLQFEEELAPLLNELEQHFQPFYQSSEFRIFDIMLASHFWGLFILPEYRFSDKLHRYLNQVKNLCQFEYHKDFWEESRLK